MAVDQYWSGVAFTKSWWPVLLLPIFLISFLGLLIGCIWLVVSVIRRRTKPVWLSLWIFPVLFFGMQSIPIPGFVDGMAHRLHRDFSAADFQSFADQARTLKVDWTTHSKEAENGMATLKDAFPRIMGLSDIEPRVTLTDSHVDIFYGSALVKHWGVRVLDREDRANPFTSDERAYYVEALPRVWVYHLPY
jgi:hypothetical protein